MRFFFRSTKREKMRNVFRFQNFILKMTEIQHEIQDTRYKIDQTKLRLTTDIKVDFHRRRNVSFRSNVESFRFLVATTSRTRMSNVAARIGSSEDEFDSFQGTRSSSMKLFEKIFTEQNLRKLNVFSFFANRSSDSTFLPREKILTKLSRQIISSFDSVDD